MLRLLGGVRLDGGDDGPVGPRALRIDEMVARWAWVNPAPISVRRFVQPAFVPAGPSRLGAAIAEAWGYSAVPENPRRLVIDPSALADLVLAPSRWIGAVVDWWRTLDFPIRRRPHLPQPFIPQSPPVEEDPCFPGVAPPVTTFTRQGAVGSSFTRETITGGAFQRQAIGALGGTRYSALDPDFARLDAPHCAPAVVEPPPPVEPGDDVGYGEGYGVNYGGS